jgi:hypothetical protein
VISMARRARTFDPVGSPSPRGIVEIDTRTHTCWTVLGVGEAYEVLAHDRLAELAEWMPEPWAPTRTAHTIAIPLQRLTGHRLAPAPPATTEGRG